jgi:hypothetical protein
MLSPYPQPSCYRENQNRSNGQPDLCSTALADSFLPKTNEILVTRDAGAEMIQPLPNLREAQLAESNASEDLSGRTAYALWVWKFA